MYQLVQRGGRIGGVDFRGQVKRVGEVGVGIGAILEEQRNCDHGGGWFLAFR